MPHVPLITHLLSIAMASSHSNLHIVMVPWLAFGHMIPFLELAKWIAQKGHRISFISAPKNIDRLPKFPTNVTPLINFVKLPLPAVSNSTANAEATSDSLYDKVPYLKKSFDVRQETMTRFLESSDSDWILCDFAPYWVGSVVAKLGIRRALFSIFNGANLGFFGPTWVLRGREYWKSPEDFTSALLSVMHLESAISIDSERAWKARI